MQNSFFIFGFGLFICNSTVSVQFRIWRFVRL